MNKGILMMMMIMIKRKQPKRRVLFQR